MIAVARCDAFVTTTGRCCLEGRDLILQVTKSCQCRHKIATSLKDSFTFGAREAGEGMLCTKSHCPGFLCVLCVSVVCFCSEFINHRDTENTEVAQRRVPSRLFVQSPRTKIEKRLGPQSGRQRMWLIVCRPLRGLRTEKPAFAGFDGSNSLPSSKRNCSRSSAPRRSYHHRRPRTGLFRLQRLPARSQLG
jgi:hypothetical protein